MPLQPPRCLRRSRFNSSSWSSYLFSWCRLIDLGWAGRSLQLLGNISVRCNLHLTFNETTALSPAPTQKGLLCLTCLHIRNLFLDFIFNRVWLQSMWRDVFFWAVPIERKPCILCIYGWVGMKINIFIHNVRAVMLKRICLVFVLTVMSSRSRCRIAIPWSTYCDVD